MSKKDGKPELDLTLPGANTVLDPGNLFHTSGRFFKRVNCAIVDDNDGPIDAFICARDHHTRVPDYNPFPVVATPTTRDGRWDFSMGGDVSRPGLCKALLRTNSAFLTIIQHGVSRVSIPLTVKA